MELSGASRSGEAVRGGAAAGRDPDGVLRGWLATTGDAVEPGAKGWPAEAWGLAGDEVARLGLRVGDLPTPVVTVDGDALRGNVALMARYCRERGVSLAPHAKTAMAPEVVRLQLAAGAWGATAATWLQARVLHASGCRRVVLANQLLDPEGLRWAAAARAGGSDVLCFADSEAGVTRMDALLAGATGPPVGVLVELGLEGGRSGCRTVAGAVTVARAVLGARHLRLRGVAAFEGIALHGRSPAELARVRGLVGDLRALTDRLAGGGLLDGLDEVVVSAGGSAVFDEVVAGLDEPWRRRRGVRAVLRSGCYVTHDSGFYAATSPLAGHEACPGALRPALRLRSRVLSRAEATRAVADFGKRDTSSDLGPPTVLAAWRDGHRLDGGPGPAPEVAELYDQHALLDLPPGHPLEPGDLLDCGVSHPCTTLDRWRVLPVVDAADRVVGLLRTYF